MHNHGLIIYIIYLAVPTFQTFSEKGKILTKAKVCMDNCGFQTTIVGTLQDSRNFSVEIESDCKSVQELAEQLKEIDFSQLFQNMQNSIIYQTASACLKHSVCLVPAAIIRTMQVESGMALPGNSSIVTEKS